MCQGVDYTYWGAILWDASGTYWKASAGKCTGKLPIRAPARLVGTPPAGCLGDLPEAGCSASRNHWNHPLGWPWNLHEDKPHGVWPKAPEARREAGSRKQEMKSIFVLQHPSSNLLGQSLILCQQVEEQCLHGSPWYDKAEQRRVGRNWEAIKW